jgi:hypothetical protein
LLGGTGTGVKVVTDNLADVAFRVECPQVLLRDNVLIGPEAAISVLTQKPHAVTIDRNYIHCTHEQDAGRFAVSCKTPDAALTRNVLIGGSYVVDSAPRTVKRNVVIGVAGLKTRFDLPGFEGAKIKTRRSTTHYLIQDLAPGIVLADNLFLGPAHAAIATSTRDEKPRITHNLFDGWNQARRVAHFNLYANKPLAVTFTNNVITRYLAPPVIDQTRNEGSIAKVGRNVFAEVRGART